MPISLKHAASADQKLKKGYVLLSDAAETRLGLLTMNLPGDNTVQKHKVCRHRDKIVKIVLENNEHAML